MSDMSSSSQHTLPFRTRPAAPSQAASNGESVNPTTAVVLGVGSATSSSLSGNEDDGNSGLDSGSMSTFPHSYRSLSILEIMSIIPDEAANFRNFSEGPSRLFHTTEQYFRRLEIAMRYCAKYQTERHVSGATLQQLFRMRSACYRLKTILLDLYEDTRKYCRCCQASSGPSKHSPSDSASLRTAFVTDVFGKPSEDSAISRLLRLEGLSEQPQSQPGSAPLGSFSLLRHLPVEMQEKVFEAAAEPPKCPIVQVLHRAMDCFPERVAEIRNTVLSQGDLGPSSDVANLCLLDKCGPAAVLFRRNDFGLWVAAANTDGGPGTRESMQRQYRKQIPAQFTTYKPYQHPCFKLYMFKNKVSEVHPGTEDVSDQIKPVPFMDTQMRLLLDFAEAALRFQQESVKLGRRVLREYAMAEKHIASEKAHPVHSSKHASPKEAYDTDIGVLLQELFVVDKPMLRELAASNARPDVLEALEEVNVADWPGPAIKRRKLPMRLAGNLDCGTDYDV